jgi:RHS repeat-associated protein
MTTPTATATTTFLHTDHLGGTSIVSDVNGDVRELSDFYPYGTPRVAHSYTGTPEQRKYAGTERDDTTSLDYMQHRYYRAEDGRFISQDPVLQAIGTPSLVEILSKSDPTLTTYTHDQALQVFLINPQHLQTYAYALNNPVGNKDPEGRFALVIQGGQAGFLIGGPAGAIAGGLIVGIAGILIGEELGKVIVNFRDSGSVGESNQVLPAPTPDEIHGKTPEEVGEIMKEKGWVEVGPSRGGGTKWQKPGSKGSDQVRIEKRNPADPMPEKQGPYGRISENGQKSEPIPLQGNPTIEPLP